MIEGDEPCDPRQGLQEPGRAGGRARRAAARRRRRLPLPLLAGGRARAPAASTEIEAAAQLEARRRRDPLYRGPSFETISAAGPHAALPHYRVSAASNRALEAGSLYLVDSGGQYLDATTDITRTIALGEPSATRCRRCTRWCCRATSRSRARCSRPAPAGAQLDSFARQALWRAGLDFDHGTGHGIGSYLCVHEGPQRIAKTGTVALKPGMIVSNEPGYYRSGAFGIRIENLVVVAARPRPAGGERELLGFDDAHPRADRSAPGAAGAARCARSAPGSTTTTPGFARDLIDLLDGTAARWLVEATAPI